MKRSVLSSIHRLYILRSAGDTGVPGFNVFWKEDDFSASYKFTLSLNHQDEFDPLDHGFLEVFISYLDVDCVDVSHNVPPGFEKLFDLSIEWLTRAISIQDPDNKSLDRCLQAILAVCV